MTTGMFSLSPVYIYAWKIHGSILQEAFTHKISLPFSWSKIIWFVCQWEPETMYYFQDQGYLIDFYTCSYVILIRSNNLYQGSVGNFNKVKSEKVVCQLKFCQAK